MRIALVVFVLIGSTLFFGYWATNQFDIALNDISAPYFASTHLVYPVRGNASNGVYPPLNKEKAELASTSLEILDEFSSGLASTSLETSVTLATSTDPKLSFTFPKKDAEVYIGCTYPIFWQSSTAIHSLQTTLVDAGTREAAGPIASGLAREYKIKQDSQGLDWKVGVVWPGAYYIQVSKINGVEAEFRSKVFKINEMPKGIDEEERINICRESSG